MSTGTLDIQSREAERVVAVIIHGFTISPVLAVVPFLGISPVAMLPLMTANMVFAIGSQFYADFCIKNNLNTFKLMSNFASFILRAVIAQAIIGLIPRVGGLANALASVVITQILGWATYLMLRDDMDKWSNLSFFDQVVFLKAAVKKVMDNREFMNELKKVRSKMSDSDRELYDRYMKTLTDKNSTPEQRREALDNGKKILASYKFAF